ncbi:SHOCT domain-containing protein [Streptomyces sp. NPDC046985]|uniref:SHOCT domain-containing protein n=1 Tax=Streptomyces sp. NPDC046985 TaxID=3155377 RepID=UPI0033CF0379
MSAQTYLAYDYPLLSAFWTMLWFFLWVMWFVLLFRVVLDVFRDEETSGWAKAGWLVFCIVLPFVGVLAYVIARGRGMSRRETAQARAHQKAVDDYIRQTAGGRGAGGVDALARLSELRSRGDITDAEFARAKEMVLNGDAPAGQVTSATAVPDAPVGSAPGPR